MRSPETVETPRSEARKSLAKAEEFAATSAAELSASRWNSSGLAGIHAGICAADAVIIATAGVRSTSPDHGAALALLDKRVPRFETSQQRQLSGLLKMKNKVEYEQRLLTETEARQLADHATRLTTWARLVVAAELGEARQR